MNLSNLKKTMNLVIKDIFSNVSYGDSYRLPLEYLATNTDNPTTRILLPTDVPMQSKEIYQKFPEFSESLLITLFAEIGVKYVPEVTLYQLEQKRPIEVFQEFTYAFGIGMRDRSNQKEIIDTDILNQVISSLQKMDSFREVYTFDSRPIYKLLSQQKFNNANSLIVELEESALVLNRLLKEYKNEDTQKEIKEVFIDSWHKPKVISNLKKRIKND